MTYTFTYTVYRLNDEGGQALYVGATTNITKRLHEHRLKSWWPNVHRCELAFFETRTEMLRFETATIKACSPRHNVIDNEHATDRIPWGERTHRILSLLVAGPASTTELRLILDGDIRVATACHQLRRRGHIKPVAWSRTNCAGGYMATWALADSDFPEVPRPNAVAA